MRIEAISGTGLDELAAMVDLRIRLDERFRADKLAEIETAVDALHSSRERRKGLGRWRAASLTADELERVTKRYPG